MPFPVATSWSLLSPEESPRVEAARWAHQARVFFDGAVLVAPDRALELDDAFEIALDGVRVEVVTMPLRGAPEVLDAAVQGVLAIGGAGFDALVGKAKRVWQVKESAKERAPIVVAAVMASVLLAPIVPPGGGTIFGVKGARARLEARDLHSEGGT